MGFSFVQALKKAIPNWDPAKHPRDRLGQFIEVGDYMQAFSGPDAAEPEFTGKVLGSYYDAPTNRMFIGLDAGGYVKWYRPKQLQNIKVKATLNSEPPKMPLPALDDKVEEIYWEEAGDLPQLDVGKDWVSSLGKGPDPADYPGYEVPAPLHIEDLDPELVEMVGLNDAPGPSVIPQKDDFPIPAGKTPEDMLGLIKTSFANKYGKDTSIIYPGGVAGFNVDFDDMLADPDHDSAQKKLAKLMTAAKLGGKQRKRYKSFLTQKHGGHQAMQVTQISEPTPQDVGSADPDPLEEWEKELLATPVSGWQPGIDPDGTLQTDVPGANPDLVADFVEAIMDGKLDDIKFIAKASDDEQVASAKTALLQVYAGSEMVDESDLADVGVTLPEEVEGEGPAANFPLDDWQVFLDPLGTPILPGLDNEKVAYWTDHLNEAPGGKANVIKLAGGESLVVPGTQADKAASDAAKQVLINNYYYGDDVTIADLKKAGVHFLGEAGELPADDLDDFGELEVSDQEMKYEELKAMVLGSEGIKDEGLEDLIVIAKNTQDPMIKQVAKQLLMDLHNGGYEDAVTIEVLDEAGVSNGPSALDDAIALAEVMENADPHLVKLYTSDISIGSADYVKLVAINSEGAYSSEQEVAAKKAILDAFTEGVGVGEINEDTLLNAGIPIPDAIDADDEPAPGLLDAADPAKALDFYNHITQDSTSEYWPPQSGSELEFYLNLAKQGEGGPGTAKAKASALQALLDLHVAGHPGVPVEALHEAGINPDGTPHTVIKPGVPGAHPQYTNTYTVDIKGGMAAYVVAVAKGDHSNVPEAAVQSAKQALLDAYLEGHPSITPAMIAEVGLEEYLTDVDSAAAPTAPLKQFPTNVHVGPYDYIYSHPQGSVIVVQDGKVAVKYDQAGKKKSSSATADKLAAGHGQWTYVGMGQQGVTNYNDSVAAEYAMGLGTSPAPAPVTQAPPTGPTAEDVAAADKVIGLLKTSMHNKGIWGAGIDSKFEALLNDPDYNSATIKLNALMTRAKLGGKQRKRYKDALAKKFGVDTGESTDFAATSVTPTGKDPSTWAPIKAGPGGTVTPTGVTGPAKGNELVNPDSWSPTQAKKNIQLALSNRLKGKLTKKQLVDAAIDTSYQYTTDVKLLAQATKAGKVSAGYKGVKRNSYGNWELVPSSSMSAPDIANPTAEQLEDALRETIVNSMIKLWAQTSNDSNPRSLAMQDAAVAEFNLKDTYDWNQGGSVAQAKLEYQKHGKMFRSFLREMYDHTQEWGKTNGVKYVRLRRGSNNYAGPVGSVVNVKLRPMSSFSTNKSTANNFGPNRIDVIVPIEWVVGTAATGFGCQHEYEWVVLGGIHQAKVTT